MLIYIKHDEQFLVNTNCPISVLLQYVRTKLEIAESELVDLCDEQGVLKLLFLSQQPQENASRLFSPRETFILCTINRESSVYTSLTSDESLRLHAHYK
uniref:FERM domain-containing protein n=1 Tax=Pygocentrus nattereri TaxID=42514 RepID=A0AAR2JH46_PYGNA